MRRADDREKEKVKGSREEFQKELEGIREDLKMIPRLEQSMELLLSRMEELMDRQRQGRRNCQTAGVEVRGGQATPGEKSSERVRLPREAGMRTDCRTRRVEMPSFDGENPDGWIFRVERYFVTKGLSENEKLEEAVVGLDGEARAWFQWEDGRRVIRSWPELKVMVLEEFRPTQGGSLEDLPSSHSKRMVEDGSGGGSETGWNRINHFQLFRTPLTGLLEAASPNDKSYGLSPNDESFSPRRMASVPNDESFSPRSMASVRHLSEVPVELGSVRAVATRDGDTEEPDSGRIWTGSGDSSELEWEPNHIRTGLRDFRARDEGGKVGRGEIALDSEDSRRKLRFDPNLLDPRPGGQIDGERCRGVRFDGGLWPEGKRRPRAATFGAGLKISGAAEAGLGDLAAPLKGTPEQVLESSLVNDLKTGNRAEVRLKKPLGLGRMMEVAQRVKGRNLLVAGPRMQGSQPSFGNKRNTSNDRRMSQTTSFHVIGTGSGIFKPQSSKGWAGFRNSGRIWIGCRDSGAIGANFRAIGNGPRNANVFGAGIGSLGVNSGEISAVTWAACANGATSARFGLDFLIPARLWLILGTEPAALLRVRQRLHGGRTDLEVLIGWDNLPEPDATWEPLMW